MVGLVENAINTAKTLIDTYHDFYKKKLVTTSFFIVRNLKKNDGKQ